MEIKKYRTFIRKNKRELNKLVIDTTFDREFEHKVNLYLKGSITQNEFDNYLDNELYTNINESILITESLASEFAESVKSKTKSIFNNLYNKLKESNGFEVIILFFDKVSTGLSKFWGFLKKINAGKLLKKILITLGITSLTTYILSQFGAGWVALMGGRMTASVIGKKIGDKVVKENLKHLMLFEEFNGDNYRLLDSLLNKINISTNSLNSDTIIKFYQNVLDSKYTLKFDKWKNELIEILKLLKNASNSRNEDRIKESLTKLKNHLYIDDKGNSKIVSDINLKSYLSKSDGRRFGNLHGEILTILSSYSLIKGDEKPEEKPGVSKKEKSKKEEDPSHIDDVQDVDSGDNKFEDQTDDPGVDGSSDTFEDKPSVWSKIGSSISKFFKILRKLKWAIVIFFGVVFILNLIFPPIFEPLLSIANVSSFGMILSDDFEETSNNINSIPKVKTEDINLKLDISNDLPAESEVTKNIQETINDVKNNISSNPKAATNEIADLVNNMKSNVLYDDSTGKWSDFLELGEYKYLGKFTFKNPKDEINFFIGLYRDYKDPRTLAKLIDLRDGTLDKNLDMGTHNKEEVKALLSDMRGRLEKVFNDQPEDKFRRFVSHYSQEGEDVTHYHYFYYSGGDRLSIYEKIFGHDDIKQADVFNKVILKNASGLKNSLNIDDVAITDNDGNILSSFNLNYDTLSKSKEEAIEKIVSQMRKMIDKMPDKVVINNGDIGDPTPYESFKVNKKISDDDLRKFIIDKMNFKDFETEGGSVLQKGNLNVKKSEFREFILKGFDKNINQVSGTPVADSDKKVNILSKLKDKIMNKN